VQQVPQAQLAQVSLLYGPPSSARAHDSGRQAKPPHEEPYPSLVHRYPFRFGCEINRPLNCSEPLGKNANRQARATISREIFRQSTRKH